MANQFPYRQGNFNQGWKPHPSIGQGQAGQAGQNEQFNKQQQQPTLWQQFSAFNERFVKMEETLNQFIKKTESSQKSTDAAIKNLKIQIPGRGHAIRYDPDSINNFLDTVWAGFKMNLVKEVKKERDGIRKDIKKCNRRSRNCRSAAVYR
ncbi:hypothetical protein LR48_Vigan205s001000 [Vigna angularis]|uniref:Uncharacterized protein n=1 Tax=Phaseolus angularis TaxID=3914 RepID=A0A0L9T5M0_PHAAN|nr:hypothetical protein LR48_Vigan205s001000 [Vigna angularis]